MVDPEIGDRRYVLWAANAFRHPGQQVLKCLLRGRLVAFMVVERPTEASRFWSLVALAPELSGKGLGRRVWHSVLAMHHNEGVEEVTTSISSHNSIAHNLYVSLGFRFPLPETTMHWCPCGPLRLNAS
jgi:RimJ/RimL family protein N-acetyltransferase